VLKLPFYRLVRAFAHVCKQTTLGSKTTTTKHASIKYHASGIKMTESQKKIDFLAFFNCYLSCFQIDNDVNLSIKTL